MTTSDIVTILSAVVGLGCSGVAVYVTLSIRSGLAGETLKQREWINGSFMRNKEVEAMFHTVHAELVAIGRRLELLEK